VVIVAGSFGGYLTAAWLSDRLGRRACFILFAIGSVLVAVTYTLVPIGDAVMLFLGFPLGFFVSGNFSGVGAFFAELFPGSVRGSGMLRTAGRGAGAVPGAGGSRRALSRAPRSPASRPRLPAGTRGRDRAA
jgi:MFS family permease